MSQDRDKRLASIMGMCWHERQERFCDGCKKCGETYVSFWDGLDGKYLDPSWKNPDFSLPKWRAKLMDWVVAQTWWNDFKDHVFDSYCDAVNADERPDFTGHLWRNLPDLVEEYWRERK